MRENIEGFVRGRRGGRAVPLRRLDVGLDVISYVHGELGDPYYMSPRILKELVRTGRLGHKTGAGFYEYPEETE